MLIYKLIKMKQMLEDNDKKVKDSIRVLIANNVEFESFEDGYRLELSNNIQFFPKAGIFYDKDRDYRGLGLDVLLSYYFNILNKEIECDT